MSPRTFPLVIVAAIAGFMAAPFLITAAPYESTMGLVQKIFYFHAPSGMMMFLAAFLSGGAGAVYLFKGRPGADRLSLAAAELTVLFGLIVLVTGPLWARKAWGVWWQWDFRLTSSLLVYWSVNVWRTLHPKTTVVPSLGPGMREPFWFSVLIFLLLFVALLTVRLRLAAQQAELESLYRDLDEGSVGA